MSYALIRKALEVRLAALAPALATAWENAAFTPTTGVPYQRVNLLANTSTAPAIDQQTIVERGIFQVTLCYPAGAGPASATARAELLRGHFPAGLVLTAGGVKVRISAPPSIKGALTGDGLYAVPVSIPFISIN